MVSFLEKYLGRFMLFMGFSLFALLFGYQAFAKSVVVFEVRKNLQLDDNEKTYHDYYLNAGRDDGLKTGMTINVVRNMIVGDPSTSHVTESIQVPVAKVKLIHVQRGVSIARIQNSLLNSGAPVVGVPNIMIGDRVDLGSAGIGNGDDKEDLDTPAKGEAPKAEEAKVVAPKDGKNDSESTPANDNVKPESVTEKVTVPQEVRAKQNAKARLPSSSDKTAKNEVKGDALRMK